MSALPIAKINCIISKAKVNPTIVRIFFTEDHLGFRIQILIPKGMKARMLALISLKRITPLSSKDPKSGISSFHTFEN
jgi:hypothetical protein